MPPLSLDSTLELMIYLYRILICALLVFGGFLVLKYTDRIIMLVGMPDWSEKLPGGTVTMWKLIGILMVIGGILVLSGYFAYAGL